MAHVYRRERLIENGKARWIRTTVSGPGPWFLDYRDLAGNRVRQAVADVSTKREGEARLRAIQSEQSKARIMGVHSVAAVRPMTFADFFKEKYLSEVEARIRKSTYLRKGQLAAHVLPFFGPLALRAINAGHVAEYMAKRAKGTPHPSKAEINRERSLVSAVLNSAFRHGLVNVNEAARVRPHKEQPRDLWLTRQDVARILEHAEDYARPMLSLAVNTGMREAEVCNLTWSDLDHSPGFIRVGYESKGGRVRFIPLNSAAKSVIGSQTRRIGPDGSIPWVFYNARRKGPYRPDSVYHSFKRAAAKAADALAENGKEPGGVLRLRAATVHTLRHSFASWAIQGGVPIAKVQQYLGHAGDHLTRRYAHLAPAAPEDRNALEALAGGEVGNGKATEAVDALAAAR